MTLTLTDATVQVGENDVFHQCNLTFLREVDFEFGRAFRQQLSGSITFTHSIPKELFFDADELPRKLDVTATTDDEELELESFLVCTDCTEMQIEFLAMDYEYTPPDVPVSIGYTNESA